MRKRGIIFSILLIALFIFNAYTVLPLSSEKETNVEGLQSGHIITDTIQTAPQKSLITYEEESENFEPPSLQDIIDDEDNPGELVEPETEDLVIHRYDPYLDTSIKLSLTNPSDGDWAYRGYTLTVSGKLWSGIPGDEWEGETVKFLYNVTESQYLVDPLSYESDPQYFIGTDVTDANGDFTINLDTSTLTTNPFSKVGVINILTWFDGNPSRGRGSGSPGAANVTFYGQVVVDVTYSVTNPGAGYSFTTQITFDNTTQITTSGTQYHLSIDWSTSGSDTNQNYTFGGTNSHTYFDTSPASVETVTYQAWYDFSVLTGFTFFAKTNASNPTTATLTAYKTVTDQTEQQVVVDAYFVSGGIGGTLTNSPIEIALDGYFRLYANLSSDTGLETNEWIDITYKRGSTTLDTDSFLTNTTGEIEFSKLLDYTWFTDIRQAFTIEFTARATDFPGATITPDVLAADLAVNITAIDITITDNTIFYTNGKSIDYQVYLQDEFGRQVLGADFTLSFPSIAPSLRTISSTPLPVTTTIPNYSGIDQTDTKTINVTALNKTGTTFRFQVIGTIDDTDTFNMYYALQLTLLDFNDDSILDGNTTSIFNNTFWNGLLAGSYNLSVEDQSGRIPLGVDFSLTLTGPGGIFFEVSETIAGAATSWFLFTFSNFNSELNTFEAYTGLTLTATGGEYTPATTIVQTIDIYGPDNDAPVISSVVLTPDPDTGAAHDPYYDITFDVFVTDVGTGVRYVVIYYNYTSDEAGLNIVGSPNNLVNLTWVGGDNYQGILPATVAESQLYVQYYIVAKDFAGHGLDDVGVKQTPPAYDSLFGLTDSSLLDYYRVGDYIAPRQEQVPTITSSPDPLNPYVNITVYTNDSIVYSGMAGVFIVVTVYNANTGQRVLYQTTLPMVNNPGTNQWYFQIPMDYNFEYYWYYLALDSATPGSNIFNSSSTAINFAEAIDDVAPNLSGLTADFPGTVLYPNLTISFSVTVSDDIVGVAGVWLIIDYLDDEYNITMVDQGGGLYTATFDLTDETVGQLSTYGTFPLTYRVQAKDNVDNTRNSATETLSVVNERPRLLPPGLTGNIGAIVGGVVGGIVGLIAILFLWFNRHTLQTYAKKQTFRRRLRDYLREIIEEIKKDGLEGRYKEGILKTWNVVEGIGREFFNLPRYKSQTPMEFARLLARRGKIELTLMYTLLEYFTKARYGYEDITEDDFNAGVRALLQIVDKIEVGEMKIES